MACTLKVSRVGARVGPRVSGPRVGPRVCPRVGPRIGPRVGGPARCLLEVNYVPRHGDC